MSKAKTTGRSASSGRLVELQGSKGQGGSLFERMSRSGPAAHVIITSGRIAGEAAAAHAFALRGTTKKVSVRLSKELIEQAKETSGITKDADLIKAGLAALAAPNAFGAWLIANEGALPEDFELDV